MMHGYGSRHPGKHKNSWDLWMFIPSNIYFVWFWSIPMSLGTMFWTSLTHLTCFNMFQDVHHQTLTFYWDIQILVAKRAEILGCIGAEILGFLDMWGSWGYESTESHHACCAPWSPRGSHAGGCPPCGWSRWEVCFIQQGCSMVVGSHKFTLW